MAINYDAISSEARWLQLELWKFRDLLWPGENRSPLQVLDPEGAARILGVAYSEFDDMGRFGHGKQRYEVAGMFDRQRRVIAVSRRFPAEVLRFTAGHELGHWVLHSNASSHRDRPIRGLETRLARVPMETEADHFSACFWVPERLLVDAYRARFGEAPFRLSHTTAYHLGPRGADLLACPANDLRVGLALASCTSFDGKYFGSLAEIFRVSATTIAIRLREAGQIV